MSRLVFPLYKSKATGAYQNAFGEFSLDCVRMSGQFEYCLSEAPDKSGLFTLESVDGSKAPDARRMTIICPDHYQHKLDAIDSTTLVCTKCNDSLKKLLKR